MRVAFVYGNRPQYDAILALLSSAGLDASDCEFLPAGGNIRVRGSRVDSGKAGNVVEFEHTALVPLTRFEDLGTVGEWKACRVGDLVHVGCQTFSTKVVDEVAKCLID